MRVDTRIASTALLCYFCQSLFHCYTQPWAPGAWFMLLFSSLLPRSSHALYGRVSFFFGPLASTQ